MVKILVESSSKHSQQRVLEIFPTPLKPSNEWANNSSSHISSNGRKKNSPHEKLIPSLSVYLAGTSKAGARKTKKKKTKIYHATKLSTIFEFWYNFNRIKVNKQTKLGLHVAVRVSVRDFSGSKILWRFQSNWFHSKHCAMCDSFQNKQTNKSERVSNIKGETISKHTEHVFHGVMVTKIKQ